MNRLILLGLLATGLVGCTTRPEPLPVASTPYRGPAPGQVITAPPPSPVVREQAAIAAGCRSDADRIVTMRDRGQLMREDERDARVGTQASIYSQRSETDRLGRIFERDRIAADCVQQNTQLPPRQR